MALTFNSEEERKQDAFAYLNGCVSHMDDFSNKVSPGAWLRPAVLSHLKVTWGYEEREAIKVLNEWIWWDGEYNTHTEEK